MLSRVWSLPLHMTLTYKAPRFQYSACFFGFEFVGQNYSFIAALAKMQVTSSATEEAAKCQKTCIFMFVLFSPSLPLYCAAKPLSSKKLWEIMRYLIPLSFWKNFSFNKQVAVLIPLKLAFRIQDYCFPSSASCRHLDWCFPSNPKTLLQGCGYFWRVVKPYIILKLH